jgi:hypothetical protein
MKLESSSWLLIQYQNINSSKTADSKGWLIKKNPVTLDETGKIKTAG